MVLVDAGVKNADMLEFLYRDRTQLAVYGMAMYGIALEKQGEKEKLAMILRNIGQYVQQDDENQTAWLRLPEGCWWYWYGSEYEAHAYYLKLLARTDPKGELAPRLVKYLLNNRKNATYWNSTRDTALCIEAIADFIRAQRRGPAGDDRRGLLRRQAAEGGRDHAEEPLHVRQQVRARRRRRSPPGKHTVELKKKGTGPLYYNGYLTNFTLEDFITKAGLEIKVNRKYYKLVKADKSIKAAGSRGQAVDQKVEKYDRQELPNLSDAQERRPGRDRTGNRQQERLRVSDLRGHEARRLRAGRPAQRLHGQRPGGLRRVPRQPRGVLRPDAGPRQAQRRRTGCGPRSPASSAPCPPAPAAMYAPELKANSDELKIGVKD